MAYCTAIFFSAVFLLVIQCLHAADPDPLQDFCVADLNSSAAVNGFPCKPAATVKPDDFAFSGLVIEGNTSNPLGLRVTPANVLSFPGLITLGVSINRVDLAARGLNPPHSHPRATELVLVAKGTVLVGFVSMTNAFYGKVLKAGEVFVVSRGLVLGDWKALLFAMFNSQQPGVVVLSQALFAAMPTIPNEVLAKVLQIDEKNVNDIKEKLGA